MSSPTLLLCGEKTKSSTRRIAEILRKALQETEYREITGAGHLSPTTHPAQVNKFINEFIERQIIADA